MLTFQSGFTLTTRTPPSPAGSRPRQAPPPHWRYLYNVVWDQVVVVTSPWLQQASRWRFLCSQRCRCHELDDLVICVHNLCRYHKLREYRI
jgi:hypothetical protein